VIGPQSFLGYRDYRYLKVALAGLAFSLIAYAIDDPPGGRSGSSWAGYSVGIISASIIFWLMWLGIRNLNPRRF